MAYGRKRGSRRKARKTTSYKKAGSRRRYSRSTKRSYSPKRTKRAVRRKRPSSNRGRNQVTIVVRHEAPANVAMPLVQAQAKQPFKRARF